MKRPFQKQKSLLVLDVDETLIHACETPLTREADFRVSQFHVYRRPFLEEFLQACAEWYEIGVWSSASDQYVQHIVNEIFPDPDQLVFICGACRTTLRKTDPSEFDRFPDGIGDYHARKNLSKLKSFGWSLERILIVDDSPEKVAGHYGNAIYPQPFIGQEGDDELCYLASYLFELKDCSHVRKIEKRGWRRSVSPMKW